MCQPNFPFKAGDNVRMQSTGEVVRVTYVGPMDEWKRYCSACGADYDSETIEEVGACQCCGRGISERCRACGAVDAGSVSVPCTTFGALVERDFAEKSLDKPD